MNAHSKPNRAAAPAAEREGTEREAREEDTDARVKALAKIREHNPDQGEDLPPLTDKQETFVFGILQGKSRTQAYRDAYNVENWKERAVWTEASQLSRNPKVVQWLSAARRSLLDRAVITREGHLGELIRLRELAIESGDLKAAINAEISRGRVAGFYVERVEHTSTNAANLLQQIRGISPAVADILAERYQIGGKPRVIEHAAASKAGDDSS